MMVFHSSIFDWAPDDEEWHARVNRDDGDTPETHSRSSRCMASSRDVAFFATNERASLPDGDVAYAGHGLGFEECEPLPPNCR
ncbi:hypothetical protein MUK42_11701 [Musa troglodytarum]|uniref:Uncharacterized protein n=1 Tax=Musa troglodytarum TaxID=320322 RepID=A0A9E7I1A5_9LILI|nr:hypothetical protein MUK42_11701 [Musa troglodytarum]